MPSVVALSCPVCAGPLSMNQEKCGYCGSLIVIKTDHLRINQENLNRVVIDEHIAEFRRDLRNDARNEAAHYGLGVAYFNLGLLEYSAEELTQAARLMPENPTIQSQLAVVLGTLVRNGDQSLQRQLHAAIEHTLKLNPSDIEALALKAEALARAGNFASAENYVDRLFSLDIRKGHATEDLVLERRLISYLKNDDWPAASPVVDQLAETNSDRVVSILRAHLDTYSADFPITIGPAHKLDQWVKVKPWLIGALIVIAIVLANALESLGTFAFFIILVGFPFFGYFSIKTLVFNDIYGSSVTVKDRFIYQQPPDIDYLKLASLGLYMQDQGKLSEIPERRHQDSPILRWLS